MADHTYTGQAPKDGANKKFLGVVIDNAGDNEFVAIAAGESFTSNGEVIAPMSAQVSKAAGFGEVFGEQADAAVYDDVADATAMARFRGMLDHLGGLVASIGTISGAAVVTDANGTVQQYLRGLVVLVVNLLSRWPASLGQKNMAGSGAVVIASDQSAIPVTVSGVATAANQATGNTSLGNIDTGLTALSKAEDEAHSTGDTGIQALAVRRDAAGALAADGDYLPLIVDNAGRLWVAIGSSALPTGASTEATLAAASAKLPAALGRLAAAASLSAALSTEDKTALDAVKTAVEILDNAIAGTEMQVDVVAALPAGTNNIGDIDVLSLPAIPAGSNNIGDVDIASVPKVASGTLANVAASATTVQLRASTAGRLGLIVANDADVSLYLKYGATASLTSFTAKIPPRGLWEMPQPIYTGVVDGIWDASPTGAARVTEV